MSSLKIKDKKVSIMVSDPWEFGDQCGVGPFIGSVLDNDDAQILIRLDTNIQYLKTIYHAVLGKFRHADASVEKLQTKKVEESINLLFFPSKPISISSVSPSDKKSGFPAIGSIKLI